MSLSSRLLSPLSLAVIALLGLTAFINLPQAENKAVRKPSSTPVSVEAVQTQRFPITVESLGTAKANEAVSITARQSELVTEVFFDDGDLVEKNQLLLRLDQTEELARQKELQASIDEAKRQYSRVKNLAKSSAASQQLLDEQSARVKMLEAQLEVARAQLQELEVHAPFAGVLGIRQVSVGSLVRPADVITTLDDVSNIKVDFSVSENHLASLAAGQRVMARSVAYPDQVFEGLITSIDSRVDPVSRSILVRAGVSNPELKLRPGMLLQITLEKEVLDALTIDEKALVPIKDKQFVFVVEDDQVTRTEVEIGERKPGRVQVLEGLELGQQVVVEGTLRIRDRSKVRVLNASMEG